MRNERDARTRGLRLGDAAGLFGIESVASGKDGALVTVVLRFFPRQTVLPAWLEDRGSISATLDDVAETPLDVRFARRHEDTLHVGIVVPPQANRFTLDIEGLIRGLDSAVITIGESQFDPAPPPRAIEPEPSRVLVDYLAKDFLGFKRLMLDSMTHELPGFLERHEPDVGIAIVEVLAYAADQLSYFQDAVATETYLSTARRRVSVRRHARLVGYRMHEGCTPRVWLHLRAKEPCVIAKGFGVTTIVDMGGVRTAYATLEDAHLHPAYNTLSLWDNALERFILARGATTAILVRERRSNDVAPLARGMVIVFENPSAVAARHAVRLTKDPVTRDHPLETGNVLVEIEWAHDDALAFDFPVSSKANAESVARGNIVAADFGQHIALQADEIARVSENTLRVYVPNLTFSVPYEPGVGAASDLTRLKAYKAVPAITVDTTQYDMTVQFCARRDVVGAQPYDRVFTVEVEPNGVALLRFGDGTHGSLPDLLASAIAVGARVGNGPAGHVGAGALVEQIVPDSRIAAVRNPLPSAGGVEPLDIAQARIEAPDNVRRPHPPKRCIATTDYAELAETVGDVSAHARERWDGTRHVVEVYVYAEKDAAKKRALVEQTLEVARPLGVELVVRAARMVGVIIAIRVTCIASANPGDIVRNVTAAAQAALERERPTLGKSLFASWIVDAATRVAGVIEVNLVRFRRTDQPDESAQGYLRFDPIEVAVLVDDHGMRTDGRPLVEVASA